jgi:hypothetical protein
VYYAGVGQGIVASSLIAPPLPWRNAWVALAAASALATLATAAGTRSLCARPESGAKPQRARWRPMADALAGYLMFGLGRVDHRLRSPQPRRGGMAVGDRVVHDRLRGRADPRPGLGGLGGRRCRGPAGGFVLSAALLGAGSLLALRQRPLTTEPPPGPRGGA